MCILLVVICTMDLFLAYVSMRIILSMQCLGKTLLNALAVCRLCVCLLSVCQFLSFTPPSPPTTHTYTTHMRTCTRAHTHTHTSKHNTIHTHAHPRTPPSPPPIPPPRTQAHPKHTNTHTHKHTQTHTHRGAHRHTPHPTFNIYVSCHDIFIYTYHKLSAGFREW